MCVQNVNQPFQMSLGFHAKPGALTCKGSEIQYGIAFCQALCYETESRLRLSHVCTDINLPFQVSSWFCNKPLAINSKVSVIIVSQFANLSIAKRDQFLLVDSKPLMTTRGLQPVLITLFPFPILQTGIPS